MVTRATFLLSTYRFTCLCIFLFYEEIMQKFKLSILIIAVFAMLSPAFANISIDGKSLTDKLPVDPKVKIGKLDNGLTYYIRENNKPEKMSTILRPNRSLNSPDMATPMTAPNKAEDTNHPSKVAVRLNCSLTNGIAPEITAISNPKRNPPNAATIVTPTKYNELRLIINLYLYI